MELKLNKIFSNSFSPILLIVPYGIETRKSRKKQDYQETFNRTLWN